MNFIRNLIGRLFQSKRLLRSVVIVILVLIAISWTASLIRRHYAWYAVFLDNDQVYFGHLSYPMFTSTAKLTDIYYMQAGAADGSTSPKIIKFGNEIQSPEDMKVIRKDHIIMWEVLKPGGAVVQAIEADKLNKKAAASE